MKKKKLVGAKKVTKGTAETKYMLRLFITGTLPNSMRAVVNIKAICEEHLKDNYELEIIDIYQQNILSIAENIISVPLLLRKFPLPLACTTRDLSDRNKVIAAVV